MPLKPGSSPKTVSTNISEFHTGPTYAHTKAKFGKKRADAQAVAAALSTARKYSKKKGGGSVSPELRERAIQAATEWLSQRGMLPDADHHPRHFDDGGDVGGGDVGTGDVSGGWGGFDAGIGLGDMGTSGAAAQAAAGIADAGNAAAGIGGMLGGLGVMGGWGGLDAAAAAQGFGGGLAGGAPAGGYGPAGEPAAGQGQGGQGLETPGSNGIASLGGFNPDAGLALGVGAFGDPSLGGYGVGALTPSGGIATPGDIGFGGIAGITNAGFGIPGQGDMGNLSGVPAEVAGVQNAGVPGGFGALQGEFGAFSPEPGGSVTAGSGLAAGINAALAGAFNAPGSGLPGALDPAAGFGVATYGGTSPGFGNENAGMQSPATVGGINTPSGFNSEFGQFGSGFMPGVTAPIGMETTSAALQAFGDLATGYNPDPQTSGIPSVDPSFVAPTPDVGAQTTAPSPSGGGITPSGHSDVSIEQAVQSDVPPGHSVPDVSGFTGGSLLGGGLSPASISAATGISLGDVSAALNGSGPEAEAKRNELAYLLNLALSQPTIPYQGPMTAATGGRAKTALSVAKRYAKGGRTKHEREPEDHEFIDFRRGGLINSKIPGRTDKIPLKVRSGAYVIPASVVSGLGEGNTMAGVAALEKLFGLGPYGMHTHKIGTKVDYGKALKPIAHLRASGGRAEAEKALPKDHQLGMKVPKGGSMCANCRFLKSPTECDNDAFVKWNGSAKLPAPDDQYCCDLYEKKTPHKADGGGLPMDGPDAPLDIRSDAQMRSEAAQEPVKIIAAGGEAVIPPHVVRNLGGGDMNHGHSILDEFVKLVRKNTIKDMQNEKPPKKN